MAKTILVVDDEERLLSLVKAYLEQGGFRVVTARNGRNALFIARQEKPDLILLDIMMPEMDGHEFIRLHRRDADTPIILLTAKVEEDDKVIGLELGADDYITKPFSPRELLARVRALLRRLKGSTPIYKALFLTATNVQLMYTSKIYAVRLNTTRVNHATLKPYMVSAIALLRIYPNAFDCD